MYARTAAERKGTLQGSAMQAIENITYDELNEGDFATFTKTLTEQELVLFAAASGGLNPNAIDALNASEATFEDGIGHGMWSGTLISAALASVMPGAGSIQLEQNLKFKCAVNIGDTLSVKLRVKEKLERQRVLFDCEVINQDQTLVAIGDSLVVAPRKKINMEAQELPRIKIESEN